MTNDSALIKVLTGLVDDLRDVAKDLARVGNSLAGDAREQVREIQYRVEAMRRYHEYLASVLQSAETDDPPVLKPAAGAEPR